jgi:hypothetical protein
MPPTPPMIKTINSNTIATGCPFDGCEEQINKHESLADHIRYEHNE